MSLAHITLPTREVEKTAVSSREQLGYVRDVVPANVIDESVWLDIGRGQQLHLVFVEGFEVSPFETSSGGTWRSSTTREFEGLNSAC